MTKKTISPYVEVNEVLKLITEEEKNKIPISLLQSINNASYGSNYTLRYGTDGNLILSNDAEAMLLYLYRKYILIDNAQLKIAMDLKMKNNQRIKNIIQGIACSRIKLNDIFTQNIENTNNESTQKTTAETSKEVALIVKK